MNRDRPRDDYMRGGRGMDDRDRNRPRDRDDKDRGDREYRG